MNHNKKVYINYWVPESKTSAGNEKPYGYGPSFQPYTIHYPVGSTYPLINSIAIVRIYSLQRFSDDLLILWLGVVCSKYKMNTVQPIFLIVFCIKNVKIMWSRSLLLFLCDSLQFTAGKIPIFFAFSAWSGYINFHFTACSTFCYIAFSFKLIKHIEAIDIQTRTQKKLNHILVYVKCGGQPVLHLRNTLNTLPSSHASSRNLCARCSRMHCIYYFYFPAYNCLCGCSVLHWRTQATRQKYILYYICIIYVEHWIYAAVPMQTECWCCATE